MRQVFVNLLSNALEAMQDTAERRLRLEIASSGEKLSARVMDSGPGFEDLNRAFDPFYTTKPVGKGTGLGLSICYGLIKEHGGEIYAENLQPRGAAVVIELPLFEISQPQAAVLHS
jgi:two-component system, NtrC family, sensor kinase